MASKKNRKKLVRPQFSWCRLAIDLGVRVADLQSRVVSECVRSSVRPSERAGAGCGLIYANASVPKCSFVPLLAPAPDQKGCCQSLSPCPALSGSWHGRVVIVEVVRPVLLVGTGCMGPWALKFPERLKLGLADDKNCSAQARRRRSKNSHLSKFCRPLARFSNAVRR